MSIIPPSSQNGSQPLRLFVLLLFCTHLFNANNTIIIFQYFSSPQFFWQSVHLVLQTNISSTPLSAFAIKFNHRHPKSFQQELWWEFALQQWWCFLQWPFSCSCGCAENNNNFTNLITTISIVILKRIC
jgi:hypothetical protein